MKRILRGALIAGMLVSMTAYSASGLKILAEKYPLSIVAEAKNQVAEIRISGALYEWNNSTELFTARVDQLLADGVQDVIVYINSPGGDVFVGAEIVNQIKRFSGSKIGFGGAIVASAATIIAIELDSFEMSKNGQFMWHKPSGVLSGNEDKIESSLTLLKNLTAQYRTMYAVKTGKTEDDIESLWAKGDVWLTADQAAENGFVTSVTQPQKINQTTAEMISAFGGPIVPVTHINQSNTMNRNAIISMLKLSADATDEQIELAIKAQSDKAATADQLQVTAEAQRKKDIDKLVDEAIVAKKITADSRETYVTLATANFEATQQAIENLVAATKPEQTPGTNQASTANWTMEDWIDKDPDGLKQMMATNPTAYAKLDNEYFKKG